MARLNIGNPTAIHFHLNYRCPGIGNGKNLIRIIPARQQITLHDNLEEHQLQTILAQLETLGFVEGSEVRHLTLPKTMLWSVERPVTQKQMDEGAEKDEEARQAQADRQAEIAGQGAFPVDRRTAAHTNKASLEIVELADPNQRGDDTRIAKGGVDIKVTVDKKAGKMTRGTK